MNCRQGSQVFRPTFIQRLGVHGVVHDWILTALPLPCPYQIRPTNFFKDYLKRAEARRHFETARVEFFKGLRAVLDARIERHSKPKARGQAINIE